MATATARRPTKRDQAAVDDLVAGIYGERRSSSDDEDRMQPPVQLGVKVKYLFRSRPGTYSELRVPIEIRLGEQYLRSERAQKSYDRAYDQRHSEEERELIEYVYDTLQSPFIEFHPTPNMKECWFGTDDEKIALFLRKGIESGKGALGTAFYEERPLATVTIGGLEFPDTEVGWMAARRAHVADNIEAIVEEAPSG